MFSSRKNKQRNSHPYLCICTRLLGRKSALCSESKEGDWREEMPPGGKPYGSDSQQEA